MKTRLLAAAFTFSFAFSMLSLALVFFARDSLGARPEDLGLIQLAGALSYTAGSVFFGWLSDRVGRPRMASLGALGAAAAFALLRHVTCLWQVYPLFIVSGFCQAAFWPALAAELMTYFSKERLHAGISSFNISWCGAMGIGSTIAGGLYERSPVLCLEVGAGLAAVASLLVLGGASRRKTGEAKESSAEVDGRRAAYRTSAYLANFSSLGGRVAMRAFLPVVAAAIGIGAGLSGYLSGALLLSQAFSFFLLGRVRFWRYNAWFLLATQLIIASALVFLFFARSYPLVMAAYAVCGVGIGLTYTSSLYYSLHNEPSGGKMAGVHEAFLGAGAGLIPFFGGQAAMLARWAEFEWADLAAFPFAAAVILALLPYQVWRLARVMRTGASGNAGRP